MRRRARTQCYSRSRRWRRSRRRCWRGQSCEMAVATCDVVNAPSFARTTVVAGHSPAQHAIYDKCRQAHRGGNEATGVATPSPTTSDRAPPVGADRPVIPTCNEATANSWIGNVGKFTVVNIERRNLQNSTVKTNVGIDVRCLKIEVMPEC